MGCVAPLQGWFSKTKNHNGKRPVTFTFSDAYSDRPLSLPCGKCIGCLYDRSRSWAVRATHEASLWESNAFVTLTYDTDALPLVNGSPTLKPEHFTLFIKALRHRRRGVRYIQAGEYGKEGRPHHHAILFNCLLEDLKPWTNNKEMPLYRSALIEELWPHGFSTVGNVTIDSAAYVAKYTLKGETYPLRPEQHPPYMTMSRRPGIGKLWLNAYGKDLLPEDAVTLHDGRRITLPRYYKDHIQQRWPKLHDELKNKRRSYAALKDNSSSRLYAQQECIKARLKLKKGTIA